MEKIKKFSYESNEIFIPYSYNTQTITCKNYFKFIGSIKDKYLFFITSHQYTCPQKEIEIDGIFSVREYSFLEITCFQILKDSTIFGPIRVKF